jgi:hypothetical protein
MLAEGAVRIGANNQDPERHWAGYVPSLGRMRQSTAAWCSSQSWSTRGPTPAVAWDTTSSPSSDTASVQATLVADLRRSEDGRVSHLSVRRPRMEMLPVRHVRNWNHQLQD